MQCNGVLLFYDRILANLVNFSWQLTKYQNMLFLKNEKFWDRPKFHDQNAGKSQRNRCFLMSFLAKSFVGKKWNRKIQDLKTFCFLRCFQKNLKVIENKSLRSQAQVFRDCTLEKNKSQKMKLKTQNQTRSTKKKFWNRDHLRSKKTVCIFVDFFGQRFFFILDFF